MKIASAVLAALTLPGLIAQQPATAPPADSRAVIRSTSQEVLLDLVVRDKRGRLVRDLKANEVEVTDDGTGQQIKAFRLVTGADTENKAGGPERKAPGAATANVDPLREVRLVTLAFERLGPEGRSLSRQAALDLLKNEIGPNLYFGVFMIDQRLSVLQQYTSDKDAIRKAVNKATTSGYSLYTDESDRIAQELKAVSTLDTAQSSPTVSGAATSSQKGSMVEAAMAQMTLNMLQFSQAMERTQQGRASIFSLWSLIKEQYRLPGRKTVLYFTEGLQVPPNLVDQFKAIIGAANRANVSVYAVDAKGLVTYAQNSSSGSMLRQAVSSSASQQNNRAGAVTPDQAKAIDLAEDSTRGNTQNALAELSESTGGFLVANTNDLRLPLRRVSEDIGTYYELAYTPQIEKYDGHFRKISVKIDRADVRVQTRTGYYALPVVEGQYLMPYEVPMLNALAATPPPRTIPYRSSAMHFRTTAGAPNTVVVIDVPLDGISFTRNAVAQSYQTHLSVLGMFKGTGGGVVQKFSRDVPAMGPLANLDAVRAGQFIYSEHAELPPGRYTLETAVLDRETLKVSAKRQVVIVPEAPKALGISSLVLVRSIAQMAQKSDAEDPFEFAGGKVTPALDDTLKGGAGANLGLYFVVYPEPGSTEPPALTLEFLQDGAPVARGEPKLPAPDATGRIAYIANSPIGNLKPGQYEVRATVKQGGKLSQERLVINIE